jgi:hypothetical protein
LPTFGDFFLVEVSEVFHLPLLSASVDLRFRRRFFAIFLSFLAQFFCLAPKFSQFFIVFIPSFLKEVLFAFFSPSRSNSFSLPLIIVFIKTIASSKLTLARF